MNASEASSSEILEIIRFRPRPGAEPALIARRAAAVAALRENFSLLDSNLCREADGDLWVDVMKFVSAAEADRAEREEMDLEAFSSWVENVEEVVSRERLSFIGA